MDQLKLMGPLILNGILKSLDDSASESGILVVHYTVPILLLYVIYS